MKPIHRGIQWLAAIGTMTSLFGCVDHDYDLSEDIDLTMAVGGELVVPTSSIAPYSMKKIMDLAEDGSSSIRPDGALYGLANGDYVLVQNGEGSNTTFSVDVVNITNIATPSATSVTPIHLTVPGDITIPTVGIQVGSGAASTASISVAVDPLQNGVHMDEPDVTHDLVSLDRVATDITGTFRLGIDIDGTDVQSTIKAGTTIDFDPALTIEIISTNADCSFKGNSLVFNTDFSADLFQLDLRITELDCTALPTGQGLVDHHFIYDSHVTTNGQLEVANQLISAGEVTININTSFTLDRALITGVTGIVDPKITVDDTSFDINDIPDFLNNGTTTLDIDNPQIYLTVDNSSNVSADVEVTLRSVSRSNGTLATININGIRVVPGHNVICISRTGRGNRSDITDNVTVANLNDLISTIPDYIEVLNCHATAVQEPVEFTLGRNYTFTTANEVLAPLAFGPNLSFVYTDKEDDWDNDDLEDYNFNRIKIAAVASNTIPLSMTPSARAIFRNDPDGSRSSRVIVNVTGGVDAGTLSNPTVSNFSIEISSEVDNLGDLSGIEYSFTASNPIVGEPINEAQAITVTSLDMTIAGGITMDLND